MARLATWITCLSTWILVHRYAAGHVHRYAAALVTLQLLVGMLIDLDLGASVCLLTCGMTCGMPQHLQPCSTFAAAAKVLRHVPCSQVHLHPTPDVGHTRCWRHTMLVTQDVIHTAMSSLVVGHTRSWTHAMFWSRLAPVWCAAALMFTVVWRSTSAVLSHRHVKSYVNASCEWVMWHIWMSQVTEGCQGEACRKHARNPQPHPQNVCSKTTLPKPWSLDTKDTL